MDIEQIKIELLNKVERLNGTHNIFQQGEKHQCELVLLMISKLHQPAVMKSVCPNCKSDDWDSVGKNCRCNKCNKRWEQTVL